MTFLTYPIFCFAANKKATPPVRYGSEKAWSCAALPSPGDCAPGGKPARPHGRRPFRRRARTAAQPSNSVLLPERLAHVRSSRARCTFGSPSLFAGRHSPEPHPFTVLIRHTGRLRVLLLRQALRLFPANFVCRCIVLGYKCSTALPRCQALSAGHGLRPVHPLLDNLCYNNKVISILVPREGR